MSNDDHRTNKESNKAQAARSDVKRRQLVQGVGLSFSVIAVLPRVKAQNKPKKTPFDPSKTEEVDEYLRYYHSLGTTKKQRQAWNRLNDEQKRAFLERYIESIETTNEGLPADADADVDVITAVDLGISQENDVGAQALPAVYDAVTAYYEGNRLYTYEHEIQWEASPSTNSYTFDRSYHRGDPNPDQNIEWVGFAGKSQTFASSHFDIYRKGQFDNTELPVSYVAHIELRGRADASGTTLYKDDGFPTEGT